MNKDFIRDIEEVINRHSKENDSNTPDFILAEYLGNCLDAFTKASIASEDWYGRKLEISYRKFRARPVSINDPMVEVFVKEVDILGLDCEPEWAVDVINKMLESNRIDIETARQLAAQAWCTEKIEHKEMDADLAEAFAQILVNQS